MSMDKLEEAMRSTPEDIAAAARVHKPGGIIYTERKDSKDPWIHRSIGMQCRSCMYYVAKLSVPTKLGPITGIGRCRRHAPTMNGYPVVFPADWCGDHKLDENYE